MAKIDERIGVVETKVQNLTEKVDEMKADMKEMHIGIDNTRTELKAQLDKMYEASCSQHAELGKRLGDLEKYKEKWIYIIAAAIGTGGWILGHLDEIIKFVK